MNPLPLTTLLLQRPAAAAESSRLPSTNTIISDLINNSDAHQETSACPNQAQQDINQKSTRERLNKALEDILQWIDRQENDSLDIDDDDGDGNDEGDDQDKTRASRSWK